MHNYLRHGTNICHGTPAARPPQLSASSISAAPFMGIQTSYGMMHIVRICMHITVRSITRGQHNAVQLELWRTHTHRSTARQGYRGASASASCGIWLAPIWWAWDGQASRQQSMKEGDASRLAYTFAAITLSVKYSFLHYFL